MFISDEAPSREMLWEVKPSTQSLLLWFWWNETSTTFSSKSLTTVLDELLEFETGIKFIQTQISWYIFPLFGPTYFSHSVHHLPSPFFRKQKKTVNTWTVVGLIINLAPTESCRVGYLEAAGFRHTFLRAKMLGAVGIGQLFLGGMRIKLI